MGIDHAHETLYKAAHIAFLVEALAAQSGPEEIMKVLSILH